MKKRLLCAALALTVLLAYQPAFATEEAATPAGSPEQSTETNASPDKTPSESGTPATPDETPSEGETPTTPDETPSEGETPTTPDETPSEGETPTTPDEIPSEGETPTPPDETPSEDETPTAPEEIPAESEVTEDPTLADEPVILVDVPDSGRVIVNPYRLRVSMDGEESTEQVVGETQVMSNHSDVPVQVMARVTGIVPAGSQAEFVTTPPRRNAREKEIFVYMEFQNIIDEYIAWSHQYTGGDNQLVVPQGESPEQMVMTLAAGNLTPAYGVFRLFGCTATSPRSPWMARDTIKVSVAFTFVPAPSEILEQPASQEQLDTQTEEESQQPLQPSTPEETQTVAPALEAPQAQTNDDTSS